LLRETRYNLSDTSQLVTAHFFKCLAAVAETLVFAYLGIALWSDSVMKSWDFGFVWTTLAGCLLGRAANIVPISWLLNRGRRQKIGGNMQFVMWFGGLRGAIAFALALNFPDESSRPTVISCTIFVVMFTTVRRPSAARYLLVLSPSSTYPRLTNSPFVSFRSRFPSCYQPPAAHGLRYGRRR
jgi:sodium/hydrogen exchanger 8